MTLESAAISVIADNNRFAYAHIGLDLTIVQTSDNFSFLLPEGMETAEGRPVTEALPGLAETEDRLQAVLKKEQEEFSLKYWKREQADGKNQYLNLQVVNLELAGGPAGLLLVIEDVTNTARMGQQLVKFDKTLKQAQAQLSSTEVESEQLNQFKTFLLSMLAHDMRTPLAAIRGYAELLLRLLNTGQIASNPDKAKGFANNICHITDQMSWLINDIMDLNQAEKGLLEMNLDSCDLHKVIHDTFEMLDSIIKLQNLTLMLELDPPGLLITADPQRMRQIANNLIGHAIKSTPSGGQITVRTQIEGENAVLIVADGGKGLTAEDTEKIFQPYYRTKEARTSNVLGSGLGLHIVKILVEAQNGRVEVKSEVGEGTTFTVYLPIAE